MGLIDTLDVNRYARISMDIHEFHGYPWITSGAISIRVGVSLATGQFAITLGSRWDPFGATLKSRWVVFHVTLG